MSIGKMSLEMHKRGLDFSTSAAILNLLAFQIPSDQVFINFNI